MNVNIKQPVLSALDEFWNAHLVCRNEVYKDGVQQLLCDAVSLRDDRTHQVHHVHLHLLIMAVTVRTGIRFRPVYRNRLRKATVTTPKVLMGFL